VRSESTCKMRNACEKRECEKKSVRNEECVRKKSVRSEECVRIKERAKCGARAKYSACEEFLGNCCMLILNCSSIAVCAVVNCLITTRRNSTKMVQLV